MGDILMTKSSLKDGTVDLNLNTHNHNNHVLEGLAIRVNNAEYAYQKDRQILRGVDLTINPGESVAVVGSSGSGKSTLLRMILRLYDVDRGSISIDSHPITELTLESLRQSMALIPQDTLMFNDTIYNNVRYGDLEASHEQVMQALEGAQLHPLISSLPEGVDTVVGERGIKLSGGERQRIAIARAILRQPRLLVCDEATSSLDSNTEADIMKTLKSVAKGRTCIFISHRLSTVQHCDTIHVLAEGRIVESGRHEDLVDKPSGLYKKMWETQEKLPKTQQQQQQRRDTRGEEVLYN